MATALRMPGRAPRPDVESEFSRRVFDKLDSERTTLLVARQIHQQEGVTGTVVEHHQAAFDAVEKLRAEFTTDVERLRDAVHPERFDLHRAALFPPLSAITRRIQWIDSKLAADQATALKAILAVPAGLDVGSAEARAGEIRAALRADPNGARANARQAVANGDDEMVRAIVTAPTGVLAAVGINAEFVAELQALAVAQRAGDQSELARERHHLMTAKKSLERLLAAGLERALIHHNDQAVRS